ncbi:peptidase [Tropicimonas sp. IMCC34043]|uniref:peptidase n=1 Tax=Tropicimonas sp. IMCC34043 TaxID=2248760 RepID=UPI000E26682E|nr:peptidase [Tropicimonas sp. IMCC34043]
MRDDIVEIARGWIGTPYCHHASRRGAGSDCLGLIRGVWRELFAREPEAVPHYTSDWAEASGEERLWSAAGRHLVLRDPGKLPDPGSVVLFRMRSGAVAKHLGIAASRDGAASFIHAYVGHGVVESALSQPWQQRIAACFDFPQGGN